jgi:hypothetical protein
MPGPPRTPIAAGAPPRVQARAKARGENLEIGQHLSLGWKNRKIRRHREIIEDGEFF